MSTCYVSVSVMFGMSLCTENIFLPLKFSENLIIFLFLLWRLQFVLYKDALQKACHTSGYYFMSLLSKKLYRRMSDCEPLHLYENVDPLNAELNPMCHLLALAGAHHFVHVSRLRVNVGYVHGHNRRWQSAHVSSFRTQKIKVMCQVTPRIRCPLILNLLYTLCLITHKNESSK